MTPERLKALFSLLDDEKEEVALVAIRNLLAAPPEELLPFLGEYQESSSPLLRKRIHRLQAILTLRERRESLSRFWEKRGTNLIDG